MLRKIILKAKLIFIPCQENDYRPKFLQSRFLFYYLIVILLLKLVIVPFLLYFPKTVFFAEITQSVLINLTNQERQSSDAGILKENETLNQAALLKARDILEKDYFAHFSPEGVSPWYWFEQAGYRYRAAGENLAIGFLDSEEVNQAWMASPSHKKNIINSKYQDVGIAIAKGDFQGRETVVVVQLFGVPQVLAAGTPEEQPSGVQPQEIALEEEVSAKEEGIAPPEERLLAEEMVEQTLAFNFFSFLALDYYDIIQKIVYGSLILVILSLLINIFVRVRVQNKPLIFRAVGFVLLLAFFSILDKELIIQIIPHEFSIYGF